MEKRVEGNLGPKADYDTSKESDFEDGSSFLTEVESLRLSLRGPRLTAAIAFVTGTGFTLFGYVNLLP